jgi:hypothetical protein
MNTFKRKSLHAAVLAGLGAVGFAGTASAVHVNPDGVGQVLLYPYYTVRADGGGTSTAYYDNYVSVVNTTNSTKAVKVRFLESRNSREVLDFNLFLSPYDVWTGAVVRTTDGAQLVSPDKSCVSPRDLFTTAGFADFKNFAYIGANEDGAGTDLDRTREGYLEVIEMGVITNATATAAAKHNSAGNPANCAYFDNNALTLGGTMVAPQGGLYGGLSLINVNAGTDYTYDAVALDQWSDSVQYSDPGSLAPNIGAASPAVSRVFTAGGVVTSTWSTGAEAVSAAMMHSMLFNEFMLETNTASGTDWVVTFPTKKLHVPTTFNASVAGLPTIPPFNASFWNGSCDPYSLTVVSREEQTASVALAPSPRPPGSVSSLCYEANVISFAGSNMLGAVNASPATLPSVVGRVGHGMMNFNGSAQVMTPLTTTVNGTAVTGLRYYGLPAIGFAIQDFSNGNVGGLMSNYGGSFSHKYQRRIAP